MTQCNTLKVILSNLQLNKSKYGIKNGTEVTLKLSSNIVGDSNDENNFRYILLLNNTQVLKFYRAFSNTSSVYIKLSKTQLYKIVKSGEVLERLLGPLLKIGLALIKSILKPLVKSVLIPLGLSAAVLATDAAIHKEKVWIW